MSTKRIKLTLLFFCLAKTMNAGLECGYAALPGTRYAAMEDRAIVDKAFLDGKLFAILDGHGGAEVSDYAKNNLIPFLQKNMNFDATDFAYELKRGIVNFDIELFKNKVGIHNIGSTACVVYIQDKKFWCANLGDSRAVLYSNEGKVEFSSHDHKVSHYVNGEYKPDEDERARVIAAGGIVKNNRVNGCLAPSRSLGDFHDGLKNGEGFKNFIEPETPVENFFNHPVGNVPDVTCIQLEAKHEFIVIGSDGLWDAMSNEDVGTFIKDGLDAKKELNKIAQELVEKVQLLWGEFERDDISVIIIKTPKSFWQKIITELFKLFIFEKSGYWR